MTVGFEARSWVLIAATLSACIYDADDRCGTGQTMSQGACRCLEGMIIAEDGSCVPCGENENPIGAKCECVEGFGRAADDQPCKPVKDARGEACDPKQGACDDAQYSYCAPAAEGDGYCTKQGCTTSADCSSGYACEEKASPSFCSRPPVGQGRPCASMDDCADYEAEYCEPYVTKTCLVHSCHLDEVQCHGTFTCCAYRAAFSVCVPPDILEDGKCPIEGTLVVE